MSNNKRGRGPMGFGGPMGRGMHGGAKAKDFKGSSKKLLNYLRTNDVVAYRELIKKLNLRK